MSQQRDHAGAAVLDRLIGDITADTRDDDEQLRAFLQALERHIPLPADAFVIGEPVSVVRFDYDRTPRRGLTAKCQRRDGGEYIVAAADVELNPRTAGKPYLEAYRRWVGIEPRHALSVKDRARCRLVGSDRVITLRASRFWDVVPGEILIVQPQAVELCRSSAAVGVQSRLAC